MKKNCNIEEIMVFHHSYVISQLPKKLVWRQKGLKLKVKPE